MSTPSARLLAALTGLALAAAALWRAGFACPIGTAAPPAPPAPAVETTIYDPDPQHLWNRLHQALWVRTGPDGWEYGHDRLDPLLWMDTKYLLEGKPHEQAIAVLDEFLARDGEKLVQDPLKRAILQRDLWAVFDWTAEPGAYPGGVPGAHAPPRRGGCVSRLGANHPAPGVDRRADQGSARQLRRGRRLPGPSRRNTIPTTRSGPSCRGRSAPKGRPVGRGAGQWQRGHRLPARL